MKCKLNGTEIESLFPCSSNCPLFGDCVVQHEKESEKRKYQTNADRFRAMSDEELAQFISDIADNCEKNTECHQHCYGCDIEYCEYERCFDWLKQPAEEG